MISIYSIFDVRGFSKNSRVVLAGIILLLSEGMAQERMPMPPAVPASPNPAQTVNYSLWPRRSPLWEQTTQLLKQGKSAEAKKILEQEASRKELTPECKKILEELKFKQIFDPHAPDKTTYTVIRGDSLFTIARKTKSSADYIMAVNNVMNPSRLNVGDKFQVRHLNLKIVIDVKKKTLSLLDNGELIKVYPILALRSAGVDTIKTTVKSESGMTGTGPVGPMSEYYPAADKRITLKTGMTIEGTKNATAPSSGFFLTPENCNELSLLLVAGNEVEIVH